MNFVIKLLLVSLIPLGQLTAQTNDPELAENLKSVMALFERNQKALKDEIASLTASNEALTQANLSLYTDLQKAKKRLESLEAENLLLRSKLSEVAVGHFESAALTGRREANSATGGSNPVSAGRQGIDAPPNRSNAPVESRGETEAANPPLVNINTATAEELMTLPLIDETMARQIIAHRPYDAVEDLIINQGFGPMKLRRVTPHVTVGETLNSDQIP